jgi:hypothetical protein
MEDFLFQLNDVTIGKDFSGDEGREAIYFLHGNTQKGHTVCVRYRGYKPFHYLSMPEMGSHEKDKEWADNLVESLRTNDAELPFDELYDYTVEYKVSLTPHHLLIPSYLLLVFEMERNYPSSYSNIEPLLPITSLEIDSMPCFLHLRKLKLRVENGRK